MVNEQSEGSENTNQTSNSTEKTAKTNKLDTKTVLVALVILVLAVLNVIQWRQLQALKADQKARAYDFNASSQKISDLEKQLADEKAKTAMPTSNNSVATPSTATVENIKASISSGNTAALEGYMAPTVKVIIAASEGIGDRTPAQAVKDLDYVKDGTDPWNFALPAATLSQYAGGSYSQFFPNSAIVGKSANKYVISFTFNSSGKISGIFMCVNSDLLQ